MLSLKLDIRPFFSIDLLNYPWLRGHFHTILEKLIMLSLGPLPLPLSIMAVTEPHPLNAKTVREVRLRDLWQLTVVVSSPTTVAERGTGRDFRPLTRFSDFGLRTRFYCGRERHWTRFQISDAIFGLRTRFYSRFQISDAISDFGFRTQFSGFRLRTRFSDLGLDFFLYLLPAEYFRLVGGALYKRLERVYTSINACLSVTYLSIPYISEFHACMCSNYPTTIRFWFVAAV